MNNIDITPLIDEGGHEIGYLAKGAHSVEEMQTVIRHYGEMEHGPLESLATYEFNPQRHKIYQRHYRYVPTPPEWDVSYTHRLEESKPGRGAFVATVVYL